MACLCLPGTSLFALLESAGLSGLASLGSLPSTRSSKVKWPTWFERASTEVGSAAITAISARLIAAALVAISSSCFSVWQQQGRRGNRVVEVSVEPRFIDIGEER